MVDRCDYTLPDFFGQIEGLHKDVHPTCLLKKGHGGPHLIKGSQPLTEVDIFYEWTQAAECPEPDECEDYISCQHFDYWRVSAYKAKKRLKAEGPGK